MSHSRHRWPAWKRVPPFVPVPVRARGDGWTTDRQAMFIGHLAETGSVAQAAARAGCSRESAYRLRRKAGAESFAAAWDAASGKVTPRRKFTPAELNVAALDGAIRIRMYGGRFCGASRTPSVSALLSVVAAAFRAEPAVAAGPSEREPPPGLSRHYPSTRGSDRGARRPPLPSPSRHAI